MIVLKHLILLVLMVITSVLAQENKIQKIVYFEESEEIVRVKASENFIYARIYDRDIHQQTAILYDKDGNELFHKTDSDRKHIVFIKTIESLNIFIVIYQGYEGAIENIPDLIHAYHLKTGNLLWTSNSNGQLYGSSPDNRYLIPMKTPAEDRPGRLEIINLTDGTKTVPDLSTVAQPAVWLDNDRIIFAVREKGINEKYANSEYAKKDNELRNLSQQSHKIHRQLKKGEISQEEFDEQYDEIKSKRLSAVKSLKEYGNPRARKYKSKPRRNIEKGFKVVVYNFKTDNIEQEKSLTNEAGENILFEDLGNMGFCHVDQDNIYLFGRIKKTITTEPKTYFLTMNKNLIKEKELKLNSILTTAKIIDGENVYLNVIDWSDNKQKIINLKTGQYLLQEDFLNQNPKYKDVKFTGNPLGNSIINIEKKFTFNNETRSLKVFKSE